MHDYSAAFSTLGIVFGPHEHAHLFALLERLAKVLLSTSDRVVQKARMPEFSPLRAWKKRLGVADRTEKIGLSYGQYDPPYRTQ